MPIVLPSTRLCVRACLLQQLLDRQQVEPATKRARTSEETPTASQKTPSIADAWTQLLRAYETANKASRPQEIRRIFGGAPPGDLRTSREMVDLLQAEGLGREAQAQLAARSAAENFVPAPAADASAWAGLVPEDCC